MAEHRARLARASQARDSMLESVWALMNWMLDHVSDIDAARDDYDKRHTEAVTG
jgi:hypothetical protein